MRKVYKFKLCPDNSPIDMPGGAEPLSVGFQGGELFLWALVYPSQPTEERHFIVRGTGHDISLTNTLKFIGTAFTVPLVFHVFEIVGG